MKGCRVGVAEGVGVRDAAVLTQSVSHTATHIFDALIYS